MSDTGSGHDRRSRRAQAPRNMCSACSGSASGGAARCAPCAIRLSPAKSPSGKSGSADLPMGSLPSPRLVPMPGRASRRRSAARRALRERGGGLAKPRLLAHACARRDRARRGLSGGADLCLVFCPDRRAAGGEARCRGRQDRLCRRRQLRRRKPHHRACRAVDRAGAEGIRARLIPSGEKPHSLGLIDPSRPVTISVPKDLLAKVNSEAILAVSIEPAGGSPTGLPTGPVIANGKLAAL